MTFVQYCSSNSRDKYFLSDKIFITRSNFRRSPNLVGKFLPDKVLQSFMSKRAKYYDKIITWWHKVTQLTLNNPHTYKKMFLLSMLSLFILDIDECSDNSLNDCHVNATCSNNNGSYVCSCNNGWTGNGFSCSGGYFFF